MKFLVNLLFFIIDFNHKKKIFKFLKNLLPNDNLNIIDVGAHHGETLNYIIKNFKVQKLLCYEASKKNFEKLNKFKKKFKTIILILRFIIKRLVIPKEKLFSIRHQNHLLQLFQKLILSLNISKKKIIF